MPEESYAGYRLQARRPAAASDVQHWSAVGTAGPAEVYIGSLELVRRAGALPVWGPFPEVVTGQRDGRGFVVVRGAVTQDAEDLRERLSPGACVAFAWHVAASLAVVHEQGIAHGGLHPSYVGLDQDRLTIRPALAVTLPAEPDSGADARATDCLHLAAILDTLDLERLDDPGIPLLLSGMRRERARLRMRPARAVRQALRAILSRHPDWVSALVETMGPSWTLDNAPRAPLPVLGGGGGRMGGSGGTAARLSLAGAAGVAGARVAPARISLSPSRAALPAASSVAAVAAVHSASTSAAASTSNAAAASLASAPQSHRADTLGAGMPAALAAPAVGPGGPAAASPETEVAPGTEVPEPPPRLQVTLLPPEVHDAVVSHDTDETPAVRDVASVPGAATAGPSSPVGPLGVSAPDGVAGLEHGAVPEGVALQVSAVLSAELDDGGDLPELAGPESGAPDGETDLPTHVPTGPDPEPPTELHGVPELGPSVPDAGAVAEHALGLGDGSGCGAELPALDSSAAPLGSAVAPVASVAATLDDDAWGQDGATAEGPDGSAGPDDIPFEVDDEATMVGRGEVDPAERPHALGPPPTLRSRPADLAPAGPLAVVASASLDVPEMTPPAPSPAPPPPRTPDPLPGSGPVPPPAAPAPQPATGAAGADGVDGEGPRWQGVGGVTGDASRADELGSGKWQEEARSLDDVRRVMDDAPVREMEEIDDSAGGAAWPALAAAAFIVFLLALGWVLFGGGPS